MLPNLKDAVLHFHLPLHHVEVRILHLVTLKLKEKRVVNELLNRMFEIQEVKVGVHESETEIFRLEEVVNLGFFLAHYLAGLVATF